MAIGGLYGAGVWGITSILPEMYAMGLIYGIDAAMLTMFTYEAWYTAWMYYQAGEYFQAIYNFALPPATVGLTQLPVYYPSGQIARWLPPPKCWKPTTLIPGPFARRSIRAKMGKSREFPTEVRSQIDAIGRRTGCHTCGTKNPGTKNGHFIPDHQAPNYRAGNRPQRLYPQCKKCSQRQWREAGQHARNPNKPIPRDYLEWHEPAIIGSKVYQLLDN